MANYDMEDAIETAEKFLEEHHSTINLKSTDLEDDVWHVIFDVGFLSEQLKSGKKPTLSAPMPSISARSRKTSLPRPFNRRLAWRFPMAEK